MSCGGDDCDDLDPSVHPGAIERCTGGVDEDCDGRTDCSDSDCEAAPACAMCDPERCTGGLDEDCDGVVDCADSDCAEAPDCCLASEERCDDALDDDCDGLIDCLDPDCRGTPSCCAPSAESCNGLDDDCDGVPDDGVRCYTLDGSPIEAVRTTSCADDWYAYDRPDRASANPVPDLRRADGVAVVVHESSCGTAIAVIADQARDEGGGSLLGDFRVEPAADAAILISDDPGRGGECRLGPGAGEVSCDWAWMPCCTDGVLLGFFNRDFCMTLRLSEPEGLTNLVVHDGPESSVPRRFGEPFELCARTVPAVP